MCMGVVPDLDGPSVGVLNERCYFDSFDITGQIFSVLKILTDSLSIYTESERMGP